MEKPESLRESLTLLEFTAGLKEPERTHNICIYKIFRPMNGSVYVRLRGKVDNACKFVLRKEFVEQCTIANISPGQSDTFR